MNDARLDAGTHQISTAGRRRSRVFDLALAVALVLVVGHVLVVVSVIPSFEQLYLDLGGSLPVGTAILMSLSAAGLLLPLVLVFDLGLFAVMYRVSKHRGPGWLFVPAAVYLVVFPLVLVLLYRPMYGIINLIE